MSSAPVTGTHINAKGEEKPCHATTRLCKFKKVAPSSSVNSGAVTETYKQKKLMNLDTAPAPIDVPDSKLRHPYTKRFSNGEKDDYDYGIASKATAVLYSYDYYGQEYNYGADDPDPYNVYEGLKIEKVNMRALLADTQSCEESDIPDELVEKAEKENWAPIEDFEIYGESDYYSQYVKIDPPEQFQQKLEEEYWKLGNAVDRDGILKYVRGKGHDTTGQSPAEAIKAQVEEENGGNLPPEAKKASAASVMQVKYKDIQIDDQAYFDARAPKANEPALDKSRTFAGVLVKKADGKLHLVDGHARLKDLLNGKPLSSAQRKAYYIVLS